MFPVFNRLAEEGHSFEGNGSIEEGHLVIRLPQEHLPQELNCLSEVSIPGFCCSSLEVRGSKVNGNRGRVSSNVSCALKALDCSSVVPVHQVGATLCLQP